MRCLVVYSSKTGNTRAVAEAIHAIMPAGTPLLPVQEAPAPQGYDLLCLGFWVTLGGPDPAMLAYMQRIEACTVGLFGTLGAYTDSPHAEKVRQRALAAVAPHPTLGVFLCQGKIDPAHLAQQAARPADQQRHPMTEERRTRIAVAATHPDAQDFAAAQAFFQAMLPKC